MAWKKIGTLADFPDGGAREVVIGARRIAIYRAGAEIRAVKNVCPHEGDALHRAAPEAGAAVCKTHGWRFDLETGACLRGDLSARIAVYPARVAGDEVWVDLG